MKKLTVYLMTALLSLTFIPTLSKAGTSTPVSVPASNPNEAAKAKVMLIRLDEIKVMDKSKLTSSEKKELRKEVRETKKYLKEHGQGVYLSVGAIILIVILLIILL